MIIFDQMIKSISNSFNSGNSSKQKFLQSAQVGGHESLSLFHMGFQKAYHHLFFTN